MNQSPSPGSVKSYNSTTAVSISQIVKLTTQEQGLVIHQHQVCNINLVALIIQILVQTPNKLVALIDDYTSEPLEITYWRADERSSLLVHKESKTMSGMRRLFGTKVTNQSIEETSTSTSTQTVTFERTAAKVSLSKENTNESKISETRAPSDCHLGEEYEMRKDLTDFKVDDYIRVLGRIKILDNNGNNGCLKLRVLAYDIKFINDPNLITMHLLEVIRDSLFYQKQSQDNKALLEARAKLPRYKRELRGRELELFSFVLEQAKQSTSGSVSYKSIRRRFKIWSLQEIATVISNIERAGLMWQSDAEDLWQPDTTGG